MTPECAADIRTSIAGIRTQIAEIFNQDWGAQEDLKEELIQDLLDVVAIGEGGLVIAGHPVMLH